MVKYSVSMNAISNTCHCYSVPLVLLLGSWGISG